MATGDNSMCNLVLMCAPSPSESHGSQCINDTASNSDYTASNDWLIVNNELERKQKEDIWLKD
jgi:hypothetical protein